MALLQDMNDLIAKRQDELKFYQGAELFRKIAELTFMKRSLRRAHASYEIDDPAAAQNYNNFKAGNFEEDQETIDTYTKRVAEIYRKTGASPSVSLIGITLAEDGKNAEPAETLEYYIEATKLTILDEDVKFNDEIAERFRKKIYDKGIPITTSPVIDETSFDRKSFAHALNRKIRNHQPAEANDILNMISEKIRTAIPGEERLDVDPFELIRIDGQTAEEKWGNKYQNLNPEQKKEAFKTELTNAIKSGFSEISLLRSVVKKNEKGEKEYGFDGKIVLVESRAQLERTRNFLREISGFHDDFENSLHTLNVQPNSIYPSAKKYYDAMNNAAFNLEQMAQPDDFEVNTYEDLQNAYSEYMVNAKAFISYQRMETEMTLAEYSQMLETNRRNNQDLSAEERNEISGRMTTLRNRMDKLQSDFEKHLSFVEKRFNRVDTLSKGLTVSTKDDNYAKPENLKFQKLMESYQDTVNLRGWNQNVLEYSEKSELPASLAWVNNLKPMNNLTVEQKNQLLEISGLKPDTNERCENAVNFLSLSDERTVKVKGNNMAEYIRDRGFVPRVDTFQSLFCMWAMAKKNLSLQEASKLYKAVIPIGKDSKGENIYPANYEEVKQYEKEFIDFVLEHPFQANENHLPKPVSVNEKEWIKENLKTIQENSIKAWSDVFYNSLKKAKEYSFPDIDYSDTNQINKYADELNLVRGIGVDGIQEYERLLKCNCPYFDTRRFAAEYLGNKAKEQGSDLDGETVFHGIMQDFADIQSLLNLAYNLPHVKVDPRGLSAGNVITGLAFYRANAGQLMSNYKGKTLGDVLENHGKELSGYNNSFVLKILEEYYEDKPVDLNNPQEVNNQNAAGMTSSRPLKEAVSYLLNQNTDSFNERVKNSREKALKSLYADNPPMDIAGNVLEARSEPVSNYVKAKLLEADDAQSMQAFLTRRVDGELTGKDYIAKKFQLMVPRNFHGYFLKEGFKDSDFFLINGQKPSELWGNKYSYINDPEEKEWLYRAEILKSISAGVDTIKTRMFQLDENAKFVEKEPITLYEDNQKMQNLVRNYKDYRLGKADILSMLYKTREELISTQEDPNANFYSTDRTGSELYQNFCFAVRDAIKVLEKSSSKPDEVYDKIVNLNNAATNYGNKREGILFGPRSEEGKIRLRNAWNFTEQRPERYGNWVYDYYNAIRRDLRSDLCIAPPDFKADSEITDIDLHSGLEKLNSGLGNEPINLGGDEDKLTRERILSSLQSIRAQEEYRNINSLSPERQNAIRFQMQFYTAKLAKPLNDGPQENLRLSLAQKARRFWYETDRLEKNQAFQRYYKEDPEGCVKNWETIEKASETLRADNAKWIRQRTKERNRSEFGYITGVDANAEFTPEEVVRGNQNNAQHMNQLYGRLADFVVAQILSANTNEARTLRWEIARGTLKKEELKNQVEQSVREKNLLTGRNIGRVQEKLESKSLAGELAKEIHDSFLRIKANLDTQKENEIKQRNGLLVLIDQNGDGTISLDELNQITQGSTLNLMKDADAGMVEAGGRLNSTVRITETVKQEGQPDQKIEKDVPLNFSNLSASTGLRFYRIPTLQRDFLLWTMGAKNKKFEDALRICNTVPKIENGRVTNERALKEADQLRYEFYNFVKDHPVKFAQNGPVPVNQIEEKRAEYTKNYKEWTNVFHNATQQMKKYKIPDINYRNPEEVKKHLATLECLATLGTEAGQEMNSLFHSSTLVNGNNIARETLGEKEYQEMSTFWYKLSDSMRALSLSFQIPMLNAGMDKDLFKNAVVSHAFVREKAMDDMQSFRGLTVGQIADKTIKDASMHIHGKTIGEIYNQARTEGYRGLKFGDAIEYLQGKNDGAFVKNARNAVESETAVNKAKLKEDYLKDICSFRTDAINQFSPLRERIINIPDQDTRFMTEALNEILPDGKGTTVRDYLTSHFNTLMNSGTVMPIIHSKNMKVTDLFLVDGIPFKDYIGWKYENLDDNVKQDSAKKEECLRMEFVKLMLKGDHEISVRSFDVRNNEFVEQESVCMIPKKEFVKQSVENLRAVKFVLQDIHDELTALKSRLQLTQNNPNANFTNNTEPEGNTQYYKDFTKCIKRALEVTDPTKSYTREDIERAFEQLATQADLYYKKHTGFFGGEPHYENGKIRYHISDTLKTDAPEYLRRFRSYMDKVANNTLSNGEVTLQDDDFSRAEDNLLKIADGLDMRNDIEDPETCRQMYYKNEMNRELVDFRANYDIEKYRNAGLKEKAVIMFNSAKNYLNELWEKKINNNTLTYKDLQTVRRPDERLTNLATNQVFLRMYLKDKENCLNTWEGIEQVVSEREEKLQTWVNNIRTDYDALSFYVAGFGKRAPNDKRDISIAQLENKIVNNFYNTRADEMMYYRLAEVTLYSIMLSDSDLGKRLRYEDAVNPYVNKENWGFLTELCRSLGGKMQVKGILSEKNWNETIYKLESGTLTKEVESMIEKSNMLKHVEHKIQRNAAKRRQAEPVPIPEEIKNEINNEKPEDKKNEVKNEIKNEINNEKPEEEKDDNDLRIEDVDEALDDNSNQFFDEDDPEMNNILNDLNKGEKIKDIQEVKNSREFMEQNISLESSKMEEDKFIKIRKHAFVFVYSAQVYRDKGQQYTLEDMKKQEQRWITEEPFKSVLNVLLKQKNDKELLEMVDTRKFPQEFERIKENLNPEIEKGMPKKINPEEKMNLSEIKNNPFKI